MIEVLDRTDSERRIRDSGSQELFTSWSWLSLIFDCYGIPVLTIADRETGALLPVGMIDDLAGRRLIVLPFCDYVLLPFGWDMFARLADAALDAFPTSSISVRWGSAPAAPSQNGSWETKHAAVYHRVLPAAEGNLWQGLSQSFRNQVRQGQRQNVTARRDDSLAALDRFYSLHTSVRNNKFRQIPQPRRFF